MVGATQLREKEGDDLPPPRRNLNRAAVRAGTWGETMTCPTRSIGPDELLGHAARLRRLAVHLVRDDAAADEVVQDALVAVIERPPRQSVSLGPWLGGVVRNVARRFHRSESRRARHAGARRPARATLSTRGHGAPVRHDSVVPSPEASMAHPVVGM